MSQEVECRNAEPFRPILQMGYLKSQVAILRSVEMLLALVAFISVQSAVTCKWQYLSDHENIIIQICKEFSEHSFRFFYAVTMISFLVTLTVYCIHIFSLMDIFHTVPWNLLILIQTGVSSASILLASAILAGSTYGSYAVMAGVALGFLTAIVYGFHFFWDLMANRKSGQGNSNIAQSAEGHDHAISNSDDEIDPNDADIPTLSSVTLRSHSTEFVPREATDTKTYYVEEKPIHTGTSTLSTMSNSNSLSSSNSSFKSEGRLELCNYRPTCNSSGSEDKSSWVITGNTDDASKEDNLSTGNFTVEAGIA